jgi:Ala-tRNA(Pro) deacylase
VTPALERHRERAEHDHEGSVLQQCLKFSEAVMPLKRLRIFLDQNGIQYTQQTHMTAYTAAGVASVAHVKGKEMAKAVMVLADEKLVMLVVPATMHIRLKQAKLALKARQIFLASEADFGHVFPDCELGAMPPFGNLYGIPVFVDESLTRDKEIVFNAGNHREIIKMSYADYERTVAPQVINVATHASNEHYEHISEREL